MCICEVSHRPREARSRWHGEEFEFGLVLVADQGRTGVHHADDREGDRGGDEDGGHDQARESEAERCRGFGSFLCECQHFFYLRNSIVATPRPNLFG